MTHEHTLVFVFSLLAILQCFSLQSFDKFTQNFHDEFGCNCHIEIEEILCQCWGRKLKEFQEHLVPNVSKITLTSIGIEVLRNDSLKNFSVSLEDLHIEDAPQLREIEANTLQDCKKLRTLYITRAPKLKTITDGVFSGHFPSFKMLKIAHSGLEVIPNMNLLRTDPTIIAMIDFDSNNIRNITSSSVKVKAENLILDHNDIEVIEDWSFHDSQIANLSLKGNTKLRLIKEEAFSGLKNLRTLDLSETSITRLPTRGLTSLEVLKLKDAALLWEFPSVLHFPEIQEAHLTYSYHCCAFRFPTTHDPEEFERLQSLRRNVHERYCASMDEEEEDGTTQATVMRKRHVSTTVGAFLDRVEDTGDMAESGDVVYGQMVFTPSPLFNESGGGWEEDIEELLRKEGCFHPIGLLPPDQLHHLNDHDSLLEIEGVFLPRPVTIRPDDPVRAVCGHFARDFRKVTCYPKPDAFNPCEDVMGQWVLRATVWVVLLCALLGNLAVLLVLVSARSPMTVSKFLMCHLSFADLCMGAYLLLIAAVDARTMGTYFNYAIHWQHGPGCQIAGFLTVFASELSIFTLTIITLERWYAITYAIHLNRRLHLGTAAKVMALGWLYAILMASLPILGISGYAKTSICLPMENKDLADLTYIICLLSIKGLAFLLICTCYLKMYLSIRVSSSSGNRDTPDLHANSIKGLAFFLICTCYLKMYLSIRVSSSSGNRDTPELHANRAVRSDLSVAKRMAMLVFTDFACWAPIAFFGLTAVSGYPLIDVTHSKILLVFFYPLNSCCNPFLYAILTKQYRRDVLALLARWGVCPRRGGSCVHGRTLSTNTQHHQQRQVSSVKALYRNSMANHRQVVLPSTARRLPGCMQHCEGMANDYYIHGQRSPAHFSGNISREGSPSSHPRGGSPHPIKNSFLHRPTDQQLILRRVLEYPPPSTTGSTTQSTSQVTTTGDHTTDTTAEGMANTPNVSPTPPQEDVAAESPTRGNGAVSTHVDEDGTICCDTAV